MSREQLELMYNKMICDFFDTFMDYFERCGLPDPESATQEMFARASRWISEHGEFPRARIALLRSIASRMRADFYRVAARRDGMLKNRRFTMKQIDESEPFSDLVRDEIIMEVREVVESLPDDMRIMVYRKINEELTIDEISVLLNCSSSTTKRR